MNISCPSCHKSFKLCAIRQKGRPIGTKTKPRGDSAPKLGRPKLENIDKLNNALDRVMRKYKSVDLEPKPAEPKVDKPNRPRGRPKKIVTTEDSTNI